MFRILCFVFNILYFVARSKGEGGKECVGSILHYLAPGSLSRVGGEAPPGPALQEENI